MRIFVPIVFFSVLLCACNVFEDNTIPGKWKLEQFKQNGTWKIPELRTEYNFQSGGTYFKKEYWDENDSLGIETEQGRWELAGETFFLYQGVKFPENEWEVVELRKTKFLIVSKKPIEISSIQLRKLN
jgi:hypothetical protein